MLEWGWKFGIGAHCDLAIIYYYYISCYPFCKNETNQSVDRSIDIGVVITKYNFVLGFFFLVFGFFGPNGYMEGWIDGWDGWK